MRQRNMASMLLRMIASLLLLMRTTFTVELPTQQAQMISVDNPLDEPTGAEQFQLLPLDTTRFYVGNTMECECLGNCTEDSLSQLRIQVQPYYNSSNRDAYYNTVPIETNTSSVTFTTAYDNGYYTVRCLNSHTGEEYAKRTITVYVAPNSITIKPASGVVGVEGQILCRSRGFPRPVLSWVHINGPNSKRLSISGAVIYAIAIGTFVYECTASSEAGILRRQFTLVVSELADDQFIYTILTIVLFVAVILGFTVCVCYKNQWRQQQIRLHSNYATIES